MSRREQIKFQPQNRKFFYYFFFIAGIILCLIYLPNSIWYFPDGIGYYSYLPAIWKTENFDFYPIMKRYAPNNPIGITSTGYIINHFGVGASMLWLPSYLLSLLFESETMSLIFTNFFSSLLGFGALYFLYKSLLYLGINKTSSIFIALITYFGTPLFFYTYFIPQSAHSATAFISSAYLTLWLFTRGDEKYVRWALLGLILGIMTSVREQEVLFGIVLINEILYLLIKTRNIKKCLMVGIIGITMFLIGFSPQVSVVKIMYNRLFGLPKGFVLSLENFSLLDVLFSGYHGILLWTPTIFVSIICLLFNLKRCFYISLTLLLCIFAQVIIISFASPFWGGYSFGIRYLTDCVWPVGIGLGLLYRRIVNKTLRVVTLMLYSFSSFWCFYLAILGKKGLLDLSEPYNTSTFLSTVVGNIFNAISGKITLTPRVILESQHYLFLFLILFLFVWSIVKFYNIIIKKRFIFVTVLILGYIFLFNFKVIYSMMNRIVYKNYREFLTLDEFNSFYLFQDLKMRLKYYKLIGNEKKVQETDRRIGKVLEKYKF